MLVEAALAVDVDGATVDVDVVGGVVVGAIPVVDAVEAVVAVSIVGAGGVVVVVAAVVDVEEATVVIVVGADVVGIVGFVAADASKKECNDPNIDDSFVMVDSNSFK